MQTYGEQPPQPWTGLAELMHTYTRGDDRALRHLHRRLAPRVRQVVAGYGFDPGTREDLVQLVFLKAHQSRAQFQWRVSDRDRAVARWYAAIARHAALDELRRRSRYRGRVEQLSRLDPLEGWQGAAEVLPESAMLAREAEAETRERVHEALDQLPPSQRSVVEMQRFGELSLEEIARALGLRPGAVRVRSHRAHRRLGAVLGEWMRASVHAR